MGWRITRGNSCDYARTEQSAMAVARGHDFFCPRGQRQPVSQIHKIHVPDLEKE